MDRPPAAASPELTLFLLSGPELDLPAQAPAKQPTNSMPYLIGGGLRGGLDDNAGSVPSLDLSRPSSRGRSSGGGSGVCGSARPGSASSRPGSRSGSRGMSRGEAAGLLRQSPYLTDPAAVRPNSRGVVAAGGGGE